MADVIPNFLNGDAGVATMKSFKLAEQDGVPVWDLVLVQTYDSLPELPPWLAGLKGSISYALHDDGRPFAHVVPFADLEQVVDVTIDEVFEQRRATLRQVKVAAKHAGVRVEWRLRVTGRGGIEPMRQDAGAVAMAWHTEVHVRTVSAQPSLPLNKPKAAETEADDDALPTGEEDELGSSIGAAMAAAQDKRDRAKARVSRTKTAAATA